MTHIKEGTRVRCLQGNIDKNLGAGMIGTVMGFARFSPYHSREVMVHFGDEPHPANGWFWLSAVEPAGPSDRIEPHVHEEVTTADGHGAYCKHCGETLA